MNGFAYANGAAFQTAARLVSLNSGDDLLISSGSLSYTGLTASTGNKLTFGGAGIDAGKDFDSQTANTVYYSLLLNVTDVSCYNKHNWWILYGICSRNFK